MWEFLTGLIISGSIMFGSPQGEGLPFNWGISQKFEKPKAVAEFGVQRSEGNTCYFHTLSCGRFDFVADYKVDAKWVYDGAGKINSQEASITRGERLYYGTTFSLLEWKNPRFLISLGYKDKYFDVSLKTNLERNIFGVRISKKFGDKFFAEPEIRVNAVTGSRPAWIVKTNYGYRF